MPRTATMSGGGGGGGGKSKGGRRRSSHVGNSGNIPATTAALPKQTRQRASVACASCRDRRIRCVVPEGDKACTQCRRAGQACVIKNDDERRRPISKAYTQSLSDRIRLLEEMLRDRGVVPPAAVYPPKRRSAGEAAVHPPRSAGEAALPSQCHGARARPLPESAEPMLVGKTPPPCGGSGVDLFAETHDYLLHCFWTYFNSTFGLVDRAAFETGRRCHYYSRPLHMAMLAMGFRFADRERADIKTMCLDSTTESTLQREAKALLDAELEQQPQKPQPAAGLPCIQALLLLSDLEYGLGRDRSGWLYAGMAQRLVWDMDWLDGDSREGGKKAEEGEGGKKAEEEEGGKKAEKGEGGKKAEKGERGKKAEKEEGGKKAEEAEGGKKAEEKEEEGAAGAAEKRAVGRMVAKAALMLDRYWALFLGRPPSISKSEAAAALEVWADTTATAAAAGRPYRRLAPLDDAIHEHLFKLLELAGQVAEARAEARFRARAGAKAAPGHKMPTSSSQSILDANVVRLDRLLQNFYRRLPEHLTWKPANTQTAPLGLFLLHQLYHTCLLLLHQPGHFHPAGPTPPPSVCTQQAVCVARLWEQLRQRARLDGRHLGVVGLLGIHCAGTAALALAAARHATTTTAVTRLGSDALPTPPGPLSPPWHRPSSPSPNDSTDRLHAHLSHHLDILSGVLTDISHHGYRLAAEMARQLQGGKPGNKKTQATATPTTITDAELFRQPAHQHRQQQRHHYHLVPPFLPMASPVTAQAGFLMASAMDLDDVSSRSGSASSPGSGSGSGSITNVGSPGGQALAPATVFDGWLSCGEHSALAAMDTVDLTELVDKAAGDGGSGRAAHARSRHQTEERNYELDFFRF